MTHERRAHSPSAKSKRAYFILGLGPSKKRYSGYELFSLYYRLPLIFRPSFGRGGPLLLGRHGRLAHARLSLCYLLGLRRRSALAPGERRVCGPVAQALEDRLVRVGGLGLRLGLGLGSGSGLGLGLGLGPGPGPGPGLGLGFEPNPSQPKPAGLRRPAPLPGCAAPATFRRGRAGVGSLAALVCRLASTILTLHSPRAALTRTRALTRTLTLTLDPGPDLDPDPDPGPGPGPGPLTLTNQVCRLAPGTAAAARGGCGARRCARGAGGTARVGGRAGRGAGAAARAQRRAAAVRRRHAHAHAHAAHAAESYCVLTAWLTMLTVPPSCSPTLPYT